MAKQPAAILRNLDAPPAGPAGADWAANVVGGKQWFANDPPKLAWTPVLSPNSEVDAAPTPVAGWTISPMWASSDFPFHHPFGNDWECFIEVDEQFAGLLSPNNDGSPRAGEKAGSPDYQAATQSAPTAPKTGNHRGVLGVEWDGGVLPSSLLPLQDDRIACWGRWIVDAGHTDFHTEIHPPLVMASARVTDGVTRAKLISRPYLVSQLWPEGSCFAHLKAEVLKALSIVGSQRIEAHPHILTIPFEGTPQMHFEVRADSENPPAGEPLRVSYAITARSGVNVNMAPAPPNGVRVTISFNQAGYQPGPLPSRDDRSIDARSLAVEGGEGSLYDWAHGIALALGPIGWHFDWVLDKGVLTDWYNLPPTWTALPSPVMTVEDVGKLSGQPLVVTVNQSQPYPIYGWVNVGWGRVPSGPLRTTVTYPGTWKFTVAATDPATGAAVNGDIFIGGRRAGATGQVLDCPTARTHVVIDPHTHQPHVQIIPTPVVLQAAGYDPETLDVREQIPPGPGDV